MSVDHAMVVEETGREEAGREGTRSEEREDGVHIIASYYDII